MTQPQLSDQDWAIIIAALRVYELHRPGMIDREIKEAIHDIETNGGLYEMPDLTPNGDVDRIIELIQATPSQTFTYTVTVSRIANCGEKTYSVQALSEQHAKILAEQEAANDLWSEKNADYEIVAVVKQ